MPASKDAASTAPCTGALSALARGRAPDGERFVLARKRVSENGHRLLLPLLSSGTDFGVDRVCCSRAVRMYWLGKLQAPGRSAVSTGRANPLDVSVPALPALRGAPCAPRATCSVAKAGLALTPAEVCNSCLTGAGLTGSPGSCNAWLGGLLLSNSSRLLPGGLSSSDWSGGPLLVILAELGELPSGR